MALKLLFNIPEEVMLRQEEWGTQSQELPALPWNTAWDECRHPALVALSYKTLPPQNLNSLVRQCPG